MTPAAKARTYIPLNKQNGIKATETRKAFVQNRFCKMIFCSQECHGE